VQIQQKTESISYNIERNDNPEIMLTNGYEHKLAKFCESGDLFVHRDFVKT
jgi:hypothetical protein